MPRHGTACPNGSSASRAKTELNSPWDLWFTATICTSPWPARIRSGRCRSTRPRSASYAGNGREDIVDGPLLPKQPLRRGLRIVRPAQRTGHRRHMAVRGRQRRKFDPRRAARCHQAGAHRGRHGAPPAAAAVHVRRHRRRGTGRPACSIRWASPVADGIAVRRRHLQQQDQGHRSADKKTVLDDCRHWQARPRRRPASFDEPAGLSARGR